MGWALAGGAAREVAAQGLIVGGYAFLDVPFWAAFADRRGRPASSLGLGLGAMAMAIFVGMLLAGRWGSAAAGREEEVALVAGMGLLVAATLLPALAGREGREAPAGAPAPVDGYGLSRREAEVLALAARGLSNKEIAGAMGLSEGTVRKHLERAYRKLGVRGRLEAAARLYGQEQVSAGDGGGDRVA